MIEQIKERIRKFEGFSVTPYQCPAGKWTVGYGYNYEDRGFHGPYLTELGYPYPTYRPTTAELTDALKKSFTKDMAERLLADDVKMVLSQCEDNFPWFEELDEVRAATIADMCFQMGITTLLTFKNTLKAVGQGYYTVAADNMEKSKWFKQSGRRARVNVAQMKTGKWQEVR